MRKRRGSSLKLVAVEEGRVHFDGLSFVKDGRDGLRIYLILKDWKTDVREEVFNLNGPREYSHE